MKQVALYDTRTLEFLGVLPFPEGVLCDLKFSRNGRLLLAGGGGGGIRRRRGVGHHDRQRVITIGDQFDSVLAATSAPISSGSRSADRIAF
jgi:hypothetical protein